MKRFWISWHQPTDDSRPLAYPPNVAILGWWNSGYDSNDVAQLCAVVEARTESAAEKAIKIDWPEAERWRFCEEKPLGFTPGGRFPVEKGSWKEGRFSPVKAVAP